MDDLSLQKRIKAYLRDHSTAVLVSSHLDKPWGAAVFYASDNFNLYFFSAPTSRHSMDFEVNSHAAAVINGHYWQWTEIKGLQMEGAVTPINSPAKKARAMSLYLFKFPFVKHFFENPREVASGVVEKVSNIAFYCFSPDTIFFLDNSEGFGKRHTLKLQNGKEIK